MTVCIRPTFGLGLGLSPIAPGTVGTIAGLPLFLLVNALGLPLVGFVVAYAVMFAFGVYVCQVTGDDLGEADYGGIVWDEIVAYAICLHFVPVSVPWMVAAFVAFRFFDIVKPWPANYIDRHFKTGFGVMLDDISAAAYAIAVLWICQQWILP